MLVTMRMRSRRSMHRCLSTAPVIIHGKRRIKPGMVAEYKERYDDHSRDLFGRNADVKACFAFPDPDDDHAYWHVFWARDASHTRKFAWPLVEEASRFYYRDPEYPDIMDVFGGWDKSTRQLAQLNAHGCQYHFHLPLAGFIKAEGAGLEGPPLFGFTTRRVKPGRVDDLAHAFQPVCDMWQARVPGILAASVSRDRSDPHLVHDLRIMANHAAYKAHVDKSDAELTAAMATWFDNYDTSVPFAGEMYASDTSDEGLHTSSINRATTPRAALTTFDLGGPEMIGPMPDMTKFDIEL